MIKRLRMMKLWSHTMKKQKLFEQILMKRKQPVKRKSFYILLVFLLINIALLTVVSIYGYLIKYGAKQKHLLPFCNTNNESKEVMH